MFRLDVQMPQKSHFFILVLIKKGGLKLNVNGWVADRDPHWQAYRTRMHINPHGLQGGRWACFNVCAVFHWIQSAALEHQPLHHVLNQFSRCFVLVSFRSVFPWSSAFFFLPLCCTFFCDVSFFRFNYTKRQASLWRCSHKTKTWTPFCRCTSVLQAKL